MIEPFVALDFETYAEVDLLTRGLHNYTRCPNFRVLLASAVVDGVPHVVDFVNDPGALETLRSLIDDRKIAAHNAGFERAVLERLGISLPAWRFIDTAVIARAMGAAGKLEAAAPQLLGTDKEEMGVSLIKLFSIPGPYQEAQGHGGFDPQIVVDHLNEWAQFIHYCTLDAVLCSQFVKGFVDVLPARELEYQSLTMEMNSTGWHVDMALVDRMQQQYDDNITAIVEEFRDSCDAADLNLASFPQLQEWCKVRGVEADSFNELSVVKLLETVRAELQAPGLTLSRQTDLREVESLLTTKQALGGSSLKKLKTIRLQTGSDDRLYDQYLHCGAGASYRTTGRGVQMQNLRRLGNTPDDPELLMNGQPWDNQRMSHNLRQVFTAGHPDGQLLVGDFASVESRGLAWQAGETWKLDAYHDGRGVYEEQAAKFYHIDVKDVVKEQRTMGKLGELSCGYGAGPRAVQGFAENMGLTLTGVEARTLVNDWRRINHATTEYWNALEVALRKAIVTGSSTVPLPFGYVRFRAEPAPESLAVQMKNSRAQSVLMELCVLHSDDPLVFRVIHGVRLGSNGITYFKPSERKTGDLWSDRYVDPKTKRTVLYTLYGGKLAGLMTQSLCREIFFSSLSAVMSWAGPLDNVKVVGQFHDEIVVEWSPPTSMASVTLDQACKALESRMSRTSLRAFPLAAEVKHHYRYIK